MRILIIDDEPDLASVVSRLFKARGYEVELASDGASGLALQATWSADLVLLDYQLGSGDDGLAVLQKLKQLSPETLVLMLTGQDSSKLAVKALQLGAEDYLVKSPDLEELEQKIHKLEEGVRVRQELQELRSRVERGRLKLQHPRMVEAYANLSRVAATEKVTVLILGETGTGKEHAARFLHLSSPRFKAPFVELHCAALPETLLESELFGYEAGAFTDAKRSKPGLFEQAQGGTLFLDEIGELPSGMQTKLLKVLEDRQLRRLGSVKPVDLDVRLVAATNRDLPAEVRAGRFRSDLLYRLNAFTVSLPPLRELPEDVEALARFFFDLFSKEFGKRLQPLDEALLRRLKGYAWPGNIRELRNAIERLVIQTPAGAAPQPKDLPVELSGRALPEAAMKPAAAPAPAEAGGLKAVLERHRWNKSKAAAELGISRPTLLKRLREAGLG